MSTSYFSNLPPPSSRYRLNPPALSKLSLPQLRTSIVTASLQLQNARWRLSCSRREHTSLESVNYESVDDDIPQVVNSEFDQPNNAKSDLVFHLKKAFHAVLHIEPWTVPWTVRTIVQVMLLWIASFWLVGSWIIPFLAHSAGFRKESLTYQGLALYSLLTDAAGGIAGMAILHRRLAKFFPLPSNWFKFSLGGKWHFDVGLCCVMFPLINRLSQTSGGTIWFQVYFWFWLLPPQSFLYVHLFLQQPWGPLSDSPFAIVHADELISNGFLVPLFFKPMSMEAYDASDSMPTTPSTSVAQNEMLQSSGRIPCPSLRSCRRLSRQFFQKYLDFLRPICQKLQRCRFRPRHRTANSRMQEMKKWADFSSATSPRTSSVDNWRRSFDSESSIYEAVLHCKRTIGNK
ncbi:PREDICTED: uncharacterized protein LOC109194101 isoform X1 [Ipomoea nil]|uniref:uncharacterized protein LOC109194101 isoform X1 n=1 Tax=Ipomoea nil TaxID=35883 RepID=UPI00090135B2|nr:PREDICTED: uncharacterized protein LOC109194101 isoform X1 [Ipomoea nil]